MSQISVQSLGTGNKEGYLTKCGGTIKTWKKRWFVLKGDTLFYFKTQKDTDLTGSIPLEVDSECKEEKSEKGKYHFTVSTAKRTFCIYSDNEATTKDWVKAINEKIKEKKKGGAPDPEPSTGGGGGGGGGGGATTTTTTTAAAATGGGGGGGGGGATRAASSTADPRMQMSLAKGSIPFLQDEESKVLEFWQIWSESIPPKDELSSGGAIEFHVSTSANMEKLTWRTAGPQNIFIQKMVDFFWNVGAPESEIDRLNDVGALINPAKIGSWIDMSAKGGMDGGWYFPVDILMKMAIEAADPGDPSKKVLEWSEKHHVEKCFSVGRDMGAAPPRQTEIRVSLPGDSFDSQLHIAEDAFSMFDFPPIPDSSLEVLKEWKPNGLCLSVITSSEGFVRLGLMAPSPSTERVVKFCQLVDAGNEQIASLEGALGSEGPEFVELQYLKAGFGYGVYKEGFDVVFHYHAGEEKI
eukprot:CAMPEP_0201512680 /NCGR_PEP_ID=MMETSP0161_2-20130828/4883_1 /ASSEMBLY_ACC=CAM_ASM_000251 /TAXON_ID=180227 /ORGANISM="Neoparamoeba aestuarina, Strain SoJaBio B1-5/56/2" /LENGTH=465 /DNA_ID=CAMNT_0047908615 /DNA_START=37 /DNA_END=1434 /DNA_ORIENTATION=-